MRRGNVMETEVLEDQSQHGAVPFRHSYSTSADWTSNSQSLCVHVSIALKLTWKIGVKQRFDPANTKTDTAPFHSVGWKRYAQMQRTRSFKDLPKRLHSHVQQWQWDKRSNYWHEWMVVESCEDQMLPNAWNTHYTLVWGVFVLFFNSWVVT